MSQPKCDVHRYVKRSGRSNRTKLVCRECGKFYGYISDRDDKRSIESRRVIDAEISRQGFFDPQNVEYEYE